MQYTTAKWDTYAKRHKKNNKRTEAYKYDRRLSYFAQLF